MIAWHGPFHVTAYGSYQSLEPSYMADGLMAFESYVMIAKDGRLRFAHWWTCSGQLEFFNSFSKEEEAEYVSFRDERRKKLNEGRIAAQMAIAGGMLHGGIHSIPQPILEGVDERAEEP